VLTRRKNAPAGNDRVRPNQVSGCPLTAAWAALGGKWKLIIIYWLAQAPQHFAGLRRRIPDISAKVLAEQLRELVADGILDRHVTGPAPLPVTYSLTDYGRSALPIVEATRHWGNAHMRRAYDPGPDMPDGDPTGERSAAAMPS
jgi:DNA-binding HxlR family transcriptional regulator